MVYLNKDILFLIFEELKKDKKSLYSCLLVNRTWCETAIPILWKNPFIRDDSPKIISLFNVIISHLSKESRDILKDQGINNLITEKTYQKPLFNYIFFWKYLELSYLESVIISSTSKKVEESKLSIIKNEILKVFINRNTKLIHLSLPYDFDNRLHHISGAENCLSELQSLRCFTKINQHHLEGLAKICKSIKKLSVRVFTDVNDIIKLIEVQTNLNDVKFASMIEDESIYKTLEESLIKHADTIQHLKIGWKPITRFLSHFTNLLSLEFYFIDGYIKWNDVKYFENLSLPVLKFLKVAKVPSKVLAKLIENTKETLSEISAFYDDKILIKTIYQNCPNLKYLNLTIFSNFNTLNSEIENLLINCKLLNGLIIEIDEDKNNEFNWDEFFKILTKSSSNNLFKFKFCFYHNTIKLENIKLFLDNWKDRNSLLLKLYIGNYYFKVKFKHQLENLIKDYKKKGIVRNYSIDFQSYSHIDEFEWDL
ncbi:unnamed protein product [Rhizophagus irregularis]|uniref:F-box domain-containing protein n=1 Tax=Rhizophagus irregularis TaxID=588596 RepID=A0A915ZUM9_9GLOM|nr:unnamed protein product [Rhizophagus irregularis]